MPFQLGEKEVFTSLATLPHAFCKSTKHGVGRACQILHSAAPQHNSIGDATSTAEEPATGGVKAMCSFTSCTLLYISFFHIFDFTTYSKWEEQNRKYNTTDYCFFVCLFLKIQHTPRGRLLRGGWDISSGVQVGALLCSRIGNPRLLCTLQICRNKDKERTISWMSSEISSIHIRTPQDRTGILFKVGSIFNPFAGLFNCKNMKKKSRPN